MCGDERVKSVERQWGERFLSGEASSSNINNTLISKEQRETIAAHTLTLSLIYDVCHTYLGIPQAYQTTVKKVLGVV